MIKSDNEFILVTGAGRGLGMHIVEDLLKKNLKVISASRNANFTVAPEIINKQLITQQLDVTDEFSVNRLFSWIKENNIFLKAVINNAGIGIFKPCIDLTLSEWNSVIQTNLTGTFLCSKAAFKHMKANGGGRIINIGSIADKIPFTGNSAYGVSKSGVKALSAILNEEGKFDRIRVTHITLGAVYTDIWKDRPSFSKEDMLNPDEVASYIATICSLPLEIRLDHVEVFPEKGAL